MKRLIAIAVAVVLLLTMAVTAPVAASPGPGLVGQWHLDEGSGKTAYDSSGLDNDGTLSGGRFGGALSFDGTDDYVKVPDSTSLESSNITVEAWIKRSGDPGNNKYIVSKHYGSGWNSYALRAYPSGLQFYIGTTSTWYGSPMSGPVWDGNWHHIAGTFNGSTVRLYVDGSEVGMGKPVPVGTSIAYDGAGVNIGGPGDPWLGGPYHFGGKIDEVRISNVARTSFDLTTPPSVDSNTVGLWHFNEESGQTAGDATTVNGGQLGPTSGYDASDPTWVPAGPTWTTGMFGNALSFDGTDDYVEIPHTTSLDITNQITVEAWINLDTVNPGDALGGTIIRKGAWPIVDPPPTWGFDIQFGKLRAFIYDEGSPYIANGATVLSAGVWYAVAFTYDGSEVQIYLNGVPDGNPTSHIGDIDSTSASVWIGRKDQVDFFNGIIDEVHIWDVALTPDAIDWLPPVTNDDFVLKDGTTLPLKFQLFDGDVLVTSPQWVSVEVTAEGFTTKTYMLGDGVENLRWNADGAYYIANLKTKVGDWPPGIYTATVCGIVTDIITFELSADTGVGRGNSGK